MVNHNKPTGDPNCPSHIRRAKRLAREIEEECFTETLDDPIEDSFSSQPQSTEVNDIPTSVSSMLPPPIQRTNEWVSPETSEGSARIQPATGRSTNNISDDSSSAPISVSLRRGGQKRKAEDDLHNLLGRALDPARREECMYARVLTDDLRIAREEIRYIQGKYDSVCRELERTKDQLRKLENANNFLRMHNTFIKAQFKPGTPFPEIFNEAVELGMGVESS